MFDPEDKRKPVLKVTVIDKCHYGNKEEEGKGKEKREKEEWRPTSLRPPWESN